DTLVIWVDLLLLARDLELRFKNGRMNARIGF
nr:hypothetical protein [Tanacetum cinerariifolium]